MRLDPPAPKDYLSNSLLAAAVAVTTWALWALGEERFDAYVALYTLEYTIVKALLNPRRVSRDYLFAALLAVFAVIVAYRVLRVLGYIPVAWQG